MERSDQQRRATEAWLVSAWTQTARPGEVIVEGAAIRYRSWGLEHPARPGLVFVHGFMAHARWWDHIAPHFADRYRVVALDFSGMGDSERRPRYSRRQFAREILAVADHAGITDLTLVAHSFGSVSALYACRLAPQRVTRAIVIDAHVFRPERDEPFETRPERIYPDRAAAEARFRLGPPGRWPDPAVLAYIAQHSVVEKSQGWTWKFDPSARQSIDSEPDLRSELVGMATPVDFIHGDRSEIVDADALAALAANLPGCGRPVAIALCHHHVMIEQPVALVAALDSLLANPRVRP